MQAPGSRVRHKWLPARLPSALVLCPEPKWCTELEEELLQTQQALTAAEEHAEVAQREVARLLQHTRTGAEQSVGSQDTSELEALESMVRCCGAVVPVLL